MAQIICVICCYCCCCLDEATFGNGTKRARQWREGPNLLPVSSGNTNGIGGFVSRYKQQFVVVVVYLFVCLDNYSRGKLSSDNDSFATDAFSELPHNSSIVFDVVEVNKQTNKTTT